MVLVKQELVRINSNDNIEMVGILYEPEEKSKKIVIHVHGLCGNFYENRFHNYGISLWSICLRNFIGFTQRSEIL